MNDWRKRWGCSGGYVISRNENGNTIKSPEATDEDLVNYTKFAINLLYKRDFNVTVNDKTNKVGFQMEKHDLFENFIRDETGKYIIAYSYSGISHTLGVNKNNDGEIPFWYENPMDLFTALEHEFGHEKLGINFSFFIPYLFWGKDTDFLGIQEKENILYPYGILPVKNNSLPRERKINSMHLVYDIAQRYNEVLTIKNYEHQSAFYSETTYRYKKQSEDYLYANQKYLHYYLQAVVLYNSRFDK